MFLTTHYLEEAERLCTRVAFIVNGQIVRIGNVSELLTEGIRGRKLEFVVDGFKGIDIIDKLKKTVPRYKCRY